MFFASDKGWYAYTSEASSKSDEAVSKGQRLSFPTGRPAKFGMLIFEIAFK
jgi:hypothetical protein